MVGSGILDEFASLFVTALVSIAILVIVEVWFILSFFFIEEKYKSRKQLKTDVIIESKTINGVQKSDTIYVYHLK